MSKFDMVKFEKGQVWKIYFKDKNEPKGREQEKNRPWIILSTRKFNQSSGMITAAPLTTRDSISSPAQVIFQDMRGLNSVILCEQMRTFDYNSGAYIFEYMGSVSDEVIEMLDNALSIHLGLRFAPSTLDRLYNSIESIMRSIEMTKNKIAEPKFSEDDVIRFADMLKSLIPSTPRIDRIPIIDTVVEDQEEPEINNLHHPDNVEWDAKQSHEESDVKSEVSSCSEKKPQKRKWTKEMYKEFLDDTETLPMEEILNKWDMTKKQQVYYAKHYAKEMLKK